MRFTSNRIIAYSNEHNSREIKFEIEDELQDCDIYIDFELPDGSKYKTARLTDLTSYVLPNALLEYCGQLKAQLVAYRNTIFIQKSNVAYFIIKQSINASQDIVTSQPDAIEELQTGKGDGLSYSNNQLQLTADGNPIGNAVEIAGDFIRITGSRENPIYMKDLQDGNYIVNGMIRPNANADITIYESNQIIDVYRDSSKVYVYRINRASSIDYFVVDIDDDEYQRIELPLDEIQKDTMPIDDAMDVMYCYMHDKIKYENSVTQTLMIHFTFPPTMLGNYSSKVVFKIGETIPQFFEVEGAVVKWIGDSIVNNQLVFQTNKIYTINFVKDVFDLVGRVETRDY